ncbi:MAG: FAD-binding oxidoreductase [Silvanigrellales bacterium]|nr:FAD-binding oxidoreductase [Silvanigrellales bacterium]
MAKHDRYDVVVVGGGFFGCRLATSLAREGRSVLLLEREDDLMQRASLNNQARVHNGYHYSRHFLTALRSRVNFPRFVQDFGPCVVDSFEKYYAVGRAFSKVTARHFVSVMDRVGAPVRPAPARVVALFEPKLVESVFSVVEVSFDADKLRDITRDGLDAAGVDWKTGAHVSSVARGAKEGIDLNAVLGSEPSHFNAKNVFLCNYSGINETLANSGLPLVPMRHELAEICLVEVPEPLRNMGVTLMCGPFFSLMPFPTRGLHSLSHVRYTPHSHWVDSAGSYIPASEVLESFPRNTRFAHIERDASRYLPILVGCKHKDSIWEVKTMLPASENDDGRPILFKANYGIPGLSCVMGGKIDNVFDIQEETARMKAS